MQADALIEGAFLAFEAKKSRGDYHGQFDLVRPNRFLVVDRFLDSRCQSRLSYAWWRSIFKEKGFIQTRELRATEFSITI
jgi:hypothetical protein